jgi:SAM-dependent methyltransferase
VTGAPLQLNIGAGAHQPDGWTSVEPHPTYAAAIASNVIDGLPVDTGTVDRVLCQHVLEHVPWSDVPRFLAEIRRVLRPDGQLLAVGPDVLRAIAGFHRGDGTCPWWLVLSTMEHDASSLGSEAFPAAPAGGHTVDTGSADNGFRHQWNCYQDRLEFALEHAGFAVTAVDIASDPLDGWPLITRAEWQCAALGTV